MQEPKILLIEDEVNVANFVQRGLAEDGFTVAIAPSGEVAFRRLEEEWDLIILDRMLPDLPGDAVLRYVGQKMNRPPVLVLTAKGSVEDKIEMFKDGCDDYLTKPFAFEELLGRIKALLRRSRCVAQDRYRYEDFVLDSSSFELSVGKEVVHLTPKEASLCQFFLNEAGKVVNRMHLLQSVWGLNREPSTNFLQVHVANLRKKLAGVNREGWLRTVRGSGYLFGRPEVSGGY